MATPQSPDSRPIDLETPGDVDTPDTPIAALPDTPTDSVTDFPMSELEATEDRETVADVEPAIASGARIAREYQSAQADTSTDADILREQAISDSHARDDLQDKQDTEEERLVAEDEDTSSDLKQGVEIQISGER
jgi:preprotein translocase subunit Sec63